LEKIIKFHYSYSCNHYYVSVGGIFDLPGDNGWKACQQPDAEPLKLTVEFRCLGPGANIMMDLRGEMRDRWFYRFCKYR
jgi:hypothetical protein